MMSVEGWESKPLFELLELIMDFRGRTPKKLEMEWGGGDIPALSANNVEMGKINFSKECYFASDALYRKWMTKGDIQKGDVVLTTEAPLGNVAIIPDEQRYILSQRVILLRASSSDLCNNYLSHYLMSEVFQNLMRQQSSGTTATGIQRAKLEPLLIKFPSSKIEQTQIAEVLSTIDRAIAQTEAIIAKQQRIKTGLMQDLLTKGIDEHGNIRSEESHEFKDSAIGRIPVEWEISVLENQCIRVTDGTHQQVKTTDDGVPFLYVSCIREGIILWDRAAKIDLRTYELISHGREPEKGVVLYTVVGSYGYAALVKNEDKFSFQRHIAYILPNQERLNSTFLLEWMNSQITREYADKAALGNAQKTITLGELCKFPLLVPSKDEQAKIVKYLSEQNTVIDRYHMVLSKLKSQKTGLMQDLLTGKVRVTNLLQEKEPASG